MIITEVIQSFQSNKFPAYWIAYSSICNSLVEMLLSIDICCDNNDINNNDTITFLLQFKLNFTFNFLRDKVNR